MEIDQLLPHLIALGLLLLISGFFSGSETALCALTKIEVERLRTEKKRKTIAILNFVDNPRRLFITLLLGNTFVNVAFTTIAYSLIRRLPFFENLGEVAKFCIATLSITLPVLIFGEITPKTYAIRYAEIFARITARPLWIFSILISPLRTLLRGIIELLMPLFGGSDIPNTERLTAADFRAILNKNDGVILHANEREILDNVLQLREIEAREIMVPRTEMIAVEASATVQEILEKSKQFGFSRIPIYRKQIDDICGIFQVKDVPVWRHLDIREMTIENFLVRRHLLGDSKSEDTLIRQPFFVLETKKLADLLFELTRQKTKMGILLDEYGGVSGIVTIEDVLEEVVGDIVDEHDTTLKSPDILPYADNPSLIEVSGRVTVKSINQQFSLKLNEYTADTIGGFVLGIFGRVPEVGESQIEESGVRFEIAAMEGNFVGVVIMTLPEHDAESVQTSK